MTGSIAPAYRGRGTVRARVAALCAGHRWLRWLPAAGVVALRPGVGLVGHGGWGDARDGDFMQTPVRLNDHVLIRELAGLPRRELARRLRALGDEGAACVEAALPRALARFEEVIVATHVPPFVESCWHEGRISDDDWISDFTNGAMGAALLRAADAHPNRRLRVLCGHTHGAGHAQIRPNLAVWTGGAVHREPAVAAVFELGASV